MSDPKTLFRGKSPSYWEQPRRTIYPSAPPVTVQPHAQSNQQIESLAGDFQWWEQTHPHLTAAGPVPITMTVRAHNQWVDPLPDFDFLYWEQVRKVPPLPASVLVVGMQAGGYRIPNDIAGYNAYVGSGALPDLTLPPATFSSTLPFTTPLTPPGSGTLTFYVLVRAQDQYGLESQNQNYTTFTIDSTGGLLRAPVPVPQNLTLYQQANRMVRLLVTYPMALTDADPADLWKIWAGSSLPNPAIDVPVLTTAVTGKTLSANIGPFSPGLVYVVVALFRGVDAATSPTVSGTVTISNTPGEPLAVPSGFQLP